jgi:hypothetical protein
VSSADPEQPAARDETLPDEPARAGSRWSGGRVVGLVFTSLAGLLGLAMLVGGLALIAAHAFVRDDDGYYASGDELIETTGYAVATGEIDLGADPADWAPRDLLGELRVRVEDPEGGSVFVGVAPEADADAYLSGAGYSELTGFDDGEPVFDNYDGRRPDSPGAQDFWVAESEGAGERQVDWDVESGSWSIVVMNADASRDVAVEASAAVKLDWLIWVAIALIVIGLVLTIAAVALVVLISRRAERAAEGT